MKRTQLEGSYMNLNEAKELLAKRIHKMGEVCQGRGCLVPSDYAWREVINDYHYLSDVLYAEYKA
ncbi:MAG: hypothetical protein AAB649_00660, partial [Patescibacteria group bacterium]